MKKILFLNLKNKKKGNLRFWANNKLLKVNEYNLKIKG